ncbi:hydroxymethylpyrimidine/phosphomethylpyrimidine kinase [Mameliella alba]|uniref:bifunctional hydroxymethylpyrimidine kinase/phosphomethylpyrimidine kinase n=1 Tax=Mameliella alba TaxID=561184 RepID=UPI001C939A71|nr:bifunctional hydroxymethylpyrimidine kinase/phosphomethylpyrimidine kinase [Mameliella alba]MBY6120469.1 hydroxymethylpyrimidine/phosphomethylpyrimidine kinase [Mameliella alba]
MTVLLIDGMDSSGGAGLLRDGATLGAMGVPYRVAVTAVTAQSDIRVSAVQPVQPEVVAAQIAAAEDVAAVKIGMLGTAAIAGAVADALPAAPLVLDPVLVSSSGYRLLDAVGQAILIARLLPRAALVTPNLPELQALGRALGQPAGRAVPEIARALLAHGCGAVLVKGGHAEDGEVCEDLLFRDAGAPVAYRAPRLPGSLRGTGCQLASAIAGGLSRGRPLEAAVADARAQVLARLGGRERQLANLVTND